MKRECLLQLTVFMLFLINQGCGPEAETGDVFKRYAARTGKYPSPAADTLPPGAKRASLTTGAVDVDYLCGKFDAAKRADFAAVNAPYTRKPNMFLRRETLGAFKQMWEAARKDGVELRIVSATRSFEQQKAIWEGKWIRLASQFPNAKDRALKILEYSAMPGVSRHHWGTDVDLNDLNNSAFEPGGKEENVYIWLKKHAHTYGFCQPYSIQDERRPGGYSEERWHWSYLPLATPLLEQYLQIMRDDMIGGFQGAQTAQSVGIIKHYAAGINPDCK